MGDLYQGNRLDALQTLEQDLLRCYGGQPRHPYLLALRDTISEFDIPRDPFLRLIEANRMDQCDSRYHTYSDLEYYCSHSAEPVGRLVLYVFGYRDEERQQLSDYTCRALQLANFWQDLNRDLTMGRLYIPLEDLVRFGYSENDLRERTFDARFRELMAFEVERARELFRLGEPLICLVDGRFKLDVALFTRSGMKVLDAIEDLRYDVFSSRPVVSRVTKVTLMLGTAIKLKLLGRP